MFRPSGCRVQYWIWEEEVRRKGGREEGGREEEVGGGREEKGEGRRGGEGVRRVREKQEEGEKWKEKKDITVQLLLVDYLQSGDYGPNADSLEPYRGCLSLPYHTTQLYRKMNWLSKFRQTLLMIRQTN